MKGKKRLIHDMKIQCGCAQSIPFGKFSILEKKYKLLPYNRLVIKFSGVLFFS